MSHTPINTGTGTGTRMLTDKYGVQRKPRGAPYHLFRATLVFSAAALCLWISLRRRSTVWMQALLAAAGIFISMPFLKMAVNDLSLALEIRRRDRAEKRCWKLCEKRIYANATLFTTLTSDGNGEDDEPKVAADGEPTRMVCVVDHNPDAQDKPMILFVHGSMAQLTQFDRQIEHFRKVGMTCIQ